MSENSGNGTNHACASCKYQRKKCHENCFLAPYFPANKSQDFLNAHRLFGISNITKILNSLEPDRRNAAVQTIIVEANARRDDPVHGCLGVIRKLLSQIEVQRRELDIINQQISYCRQREQLLQQQNLQLFLNSLSPSSSSLPLLQQFGSGGGDYQPPPPQSNEETYNIGDMRNLDSRYSYYQSLQEYEDIKPFDVKFIDQIADSYHHKKAIIKFRDAEESSAESRVGETQSLNHAPEVKNAGRVFTLTNAIHKNEKLNN